MPRQAANAATVAPQVPATTLINFPDVARSLGLDPGVMLARAGIREESLTEPDGWLAASALMQLHEAAVAETGCMTFGLLLAEKRSFASLGPISLLLKHCATLGDIIAATIDHQKLFSDIVSLHREETGKTTTLKLQMTAGFRNRQIVEFAIARAYNSLREVTGERWKASCVHFRHGAPPELAVHQRTFSSPIAFDSDFDGLSFRASQLDLPNPSADATMAHHAQRYVELLGLERGKVTFAERTRRSIELSLSRAEGTIENVAADLGLSTRMLQRHLVDEGTAFATLLNETRRELAVRYLQDSMRSVAEISRLLGYGTQGSFTRWFTREFGDPPRLWKTRHCGGRVAG
jgi:AraC-like DNA-binding protein